MGKDRLSKKQRAEYQRSYSQRLRDMRRKERKIARTDGEPIGPVDGYVIERCLPPMSKR